MSKVITFAGNSGNVIAKKRKLVKGANHRKHDEVKQYNPLVEVQRDQMETADRNNYGSVIISNIIRPLSTTNTTQLSSWRPYRLADPAVGTHEWERIGNQYFLKYIRFKGYITCRGNVHMTVNWRLVLIRSTILFSGDNSTQYADSYGQMFRNWENFNINNFTSDSLQQAARHNYHKKILNVDNRELYARKVIASGTIPANQRRDQVGLIYAGSNTSWSHGNLVSIPYGEDYRLIPIDYKIVCNDWIKVSETHYYLVFECDNVLGANVAAISSSGTGDVSLTRDWPDREIALNFFPRSYFIDP